MVQLSGKLNCSVPAGVTDTTGLSSIPCLAINRNQLAKKVADCRKFTIGQLRTPRVVAELAPDYTFMNQGPEHTTDVALHGSHKQRLRQFVHQFGQSQKLLSPAREECLHKIALQFRVGSAHADQSRLRAAHQAVA